jgi:hypothetical protein
MILPVNVILTEKDWELSLSDGKLQLKFKGIPQVIEFRRTLSARFSEELQTILRPFVFSIKDQEEPMNVAAFIEPSDTE